MSGGGNLCDVVERGVRLHVDLHHSRQSRLHHIPSEIGNYSDENGNFYYEVKLVFVIS